MGPTWLQRETPRITFSSRDPLKKQQKSGSQQLLHLRFYLFSQKLLSSLLSQLRLLHRQQQITKRSAHLSGLIFAVEAVVAGNILSRPSRRCLHWCDWGTSRPSWSLSWVSVTPFIWQLISRFLWLFLYLLMQPIFACVDILQQVLCVLTLQSKQELKVNKMWEFKEVLNQYLRGSMLWEWHLLTCVNLHYIFFDLFHLFCFTLIDVFIFFCILPNIKTSLLLTDIIIQLGSRTPTGSLTERDEDENSSPRASRSTVGEIKRMTFAFWSGRRRLFVKFQMFDELYARIVTPKRLGGLEVVGLWLNPAADQGIAIFYRTLMHIDLRCILH